MIVFEVSLVFVLVFIVYVNTSNIYVTDHKYSVATPCEGNGDCSDLGTNSTCGEDGFCVCNSSKICIDKTGIVVTKVGLDCIHNNDCNIDEAECSGGKCACKTEHVASPSGKICLKISEGIGGSCEDSVQCFSKIEFSGCQRNKCVCQQHTHEYNGSCYRDVELGQHCNNDAECAFVLFSQCVNSECSCIEKYVASTRGTRCLPVAEGLWSHCVDSAQCTKSLGGGSQCRNGICDCKEMYHMKNKTNKCVIDKFLGEICQKHTDCHEPLREESRLECVLGECKCKSFYTEVDGYCINSSENRIHSLIIIIFQAVFLQLFLYIQ